MQTPEGESSRIRRMRTASGIWLACVAAAGAACGQQASDRCSPALTVPDGFCAELFADDLGPARHLAVSASGDVYVALWREESPAGNIVALRDTNGDGHADVRASFGLEGGSGLAITHDSTGRELLFQGAWGKVYRWTLVPGQLVPAEPPETLVAQIPELEHSARSIAVSPAGVLYVNIGAPSNACERDYPKRDFRGDDPCRELRASGGIWRFANAFALHPTARRPDSSARFATGLRHTVALTVDPEDGAVYGAPQGIDHLHGWWPDADYSARDAATIPAETMFRITERSDYGFPYCMYDPTASRMVLAPAYGGRRSNGDRDDNSERCRSLPTPLATFPAHAAPLAMLVYRSASFPSHYRGGFFVALHGSLFSAPLEPTGYMVMFVPRDAAGRVGVAEPFVRTANSRRFASGNLRPSGLGVGADGALFVSDDAGGRVWRVRAVP